MRALLASAAVALLIVVWLPSRTPSRAQPQAHAAKEEGRGERPSVTAEAGEEMGRGEEGGGGAYRLTVVSRRDGSPIAGARVLDEEGRPHGSAGPDGVVEFGGEGDRWRAAAPGYFPVAAGLDADGVGWVSLPPAAPIRGRVLDAGTLEPVAGAAITVVAEDLGEDSRVETGEDGRFEIAGALWQPFWLVVRKGTYVPAEREGTLTGPIEGMEIALAPGATLRGHVLDEELVRAHVHVWLLSGDGGVPLLRGETDREGAYRIDGAPLGVELVPKAHVHSGAAVTFTRVGEVQERDIRPAAMADLVVTARDPEGRPVELHDAKLTGTGRDIWSDRADEGRVFRAPPGRYRLEVNPRGWAEHAQEVVLAAGPNRIDVLLEKGLAVVGSVVASDGSPAQEAHVHWVGANDSGSVQADAQGRFRIDGLPATPVDLSVGARGFAQAACRGVAPGGAPVVVVLPPVARITGQLVGAGALDAIDSGLWSESVWSNCDSIAADGRFEFLVEYLGEPIVVMFRKDWSDAPVLRAVPALAAGEAFDLGEVRLDGGRTVRGTVRRADRPAAGALVQVAEPWVQQCAMSTTRTDPEGRFCLLRMPTGPFWVRVGAEGLPRHFFRIEADAVELRLATGVAAGRGRGTIGRVGPSEWTDEVSIDVEADAHGDFRVTLQPGEYDGWFEDTEGRSLGHARFSVQEGETTRVEPTPPR